MKTYLNMKVIINIVLLGLLIILGINVFPRVVFSLDYTIPWLLILLGFGIFLFFYFKKKDIFHPVGIFSLIWFATIGLSNFKLSNLQSDWSLKMWLTVAFTYLFFVLGFYLSKKLKLSFLTDLQEKASIDKVRFEKFIQILFIICFLTYIVEVIQFGALPIFSESTRAYKDFGIQFVHYLTVSLVIVNFLIIVHYLKYKEFNIPFFVYFLLSTLAIVSMLSRQLIIFLFIVIVVAINYLAKRFKLNLILFIGIIALLIFNLLGNMRTNSAHYILQVGQMKEGVDSPLFAWLYLYLGMGYENLNYYINNFDQMFYGARTFLPIFAFTLTKGLIDYDYGKFLPSEYFTTSTLAYDFYLDFHLVGVILFPLLIGLLSGVIYKRLEESKDVTNVLLYSMFVHNLVFIFFINFFSNTTWFFQFCLILLFIVITNQSFGKYVKNLKWGKNNV